MKRILILTMCLFGFINLYAKDDISLLKLYFNKKDIKNIEILVAEFDKYIMTKQDKSDVNQAYISLFKKLSNAESADDLSKHLIAKAKRDEILAKIDKETLEKIWKDSVVRKIAKPELLSKDELKQYQQGKLIRMGISTGGQYLKFLNEISARISFLTMYCEDIAGAGDISPACVSLFIQRQIEFDLSDKTQRFFLAVHYLTVA